MTKETEEKSPAERIASFLDQMEPMFPNRQAAAELRRLQEVNQKLLAVLLRYRNETPLGNQPHMIAEEADKVIAKATGELK